MSLRSIPEAEYEGSTDSQQRPHGVGCLKHSSSGLEYTGQLVRGFADGYGILQISGGQRFAGQFKNGAIDGFGVLETAEGVSIIGNFKNGQYVTSQGRATFADNTSGLPYHEGNMHQSTGLAETEKCPTVVEMGVRSAREAEKIMKQYRGELVEDSSNDEDENELETNEEATPPTPDEQTQVLEALEAELDMQLRDFTEAISLHESESNTIDSFSSKECLITEDNDNEKSQTRRSSKATIKSLKESNATEGEERF